jgi:hypothetical protein
MKDIFKSKFLETLAGKLTAILSFAVILVIVLAVPGSGIEDRWLPLIYIVAIAAMGIFTYQVFAQNKRPPKGEETGEEKPETEAPKRGVDTTGGLPFSAEVTRWSAQSRLVQADTSPIPILE